MKVDGKLTVKQITDAFEHNRWLGLRFEMPNGEDVDVSPVMGITDGAWGAIGFLVQTDHDSAIDNALDCKTIEELVDTLNHYEECSMAELLKPRA